MFTDYFRAFSHHLLSNSAERQMRRSSNSWTPTTYCVHGDDNNQYISHRPPTHSPFWNSHITCHSHLSTEDHSRVWIYQFSVNTYFRAFQWVSTSKSCWTHRSQQQSNMHHLNNVTFCTAASWRQPDIITIQYFHRCTVSNRNMQIINSTGQVRQCIYSYHHLHFNSHFPDKPGLAGSHWFSFSVCCGGEPLGMTVTGFYGPNAGLEKSWFYLK